MTAQGGDGPADLTRLTVNLTPAARSALEDAALRTGDTRTDTVNIALMLYAQIAELAEHEGAYWSEYPHFDGRGSVWLLIARERPKRRWRPW